MLCANKLIECTKKMQNLAETKRKMDNAIHGSLPTVTGLHSSFLDNAKKLPRRSIKQRQGNERNELRHEMLLAEERSTEILK